MRESFEEVCTTSTLRGSIDWVGFNILFGPMEDVHIQRQKSIRIVLVFCTNLKTIQRIVILPENIGGQHVQRASDAEVE